MNVNDMRSFIAVVMILAFIAACFVGNAMLPERFLPLKDLAFVVVAYYVGTRTALDKPGA